MPNDVKTFLSLAVLIVAAVLAYWKGSPIRPEFGNFVLFTAVFMVVSMWVFPEASGKKDRAPK
jgi:membrane protein YdbS with pleckstrin-like domain